MIKKYPFYMLFIIIVSCTSPKIQVDKKYIIPPISEINDITKLNNNLNSNLIIKNRDKWYNDKNINNIYNYNFNTSKNIKEIKSVYTIKNGLLFYKNQKIDSLKIYYRQTQEIDFVLTIINGKPIGYVINVNNNPRPSMHKVYYNNDDIVYSFIEKTITLSKGNGELTNYYYGEWDGKKQKFSDDILKEEGQVKNNYKSGKWIYYNPEGQIDSIKVYTQIDSVDVRFPHCLLNKTEPCY